MGIASGRGIRGTAAAVATAALCAALGWPGTAAADHDYLGDSAELSGGAGLGLSAELSDGLGILGPSPTALGGPG